MMNNHSGGPAFPRSASVKPDEFITPEHECVVEEQQGMTLRDWFAGRALSGILAGSPNADIGPHGYAHDAYLFADAMLKEREKDQ